MVVYIWQCCFLDSSHPHLPLLCPQVRPISLHLHFFVNRLVHQYYFSTLHIYAIKLIIENEPTDKGLSSHIHEAAQRAQYQGCSPEKSRRWSCGQSPAQSHWWPGQDAVRTHVSVILGTLCHKRRPQSPGAGHAVGQCITMCPPSWLQAGRGSMQCCQFPCCFPWRLVRRHSFQPKRMCESGGHILKTVSYFLHLWLLSICLNLPSTLTLLKWQLSPEKTWPFPTGSSPSHHHSINQLQASQETQGLLQQL